MVLEVVIWFFCTRLSWCGLGFGRFFIAQLSYILDRRQEAWGMFGSCLLDLSIGLGLLDLRMISCEDAFSLLIFWYFMLPFTMKTEIEESFWFGGSVSFEFGEVVVRIIPLLIGKGAIDEDTSVAFTYPAHIMDAFVSSSTKQKVYIA